MTSFTGILQTNATRIALVQSDIYEQVYVCRKDLLYQIDVLRGTGWGRRERRLLRMVQTVQVTVHGGKGTLTYELVFSIECQNSLNNELRNHKIGENEKMIIS